jgi:hypothetical protein
VLHTLFYKTKEARCRTHLSGGKRQYFPSTAETFLSVDQDFTFGYFWDETSWGLRQEGCL